ncbi:MAG: zinc ribbon domain-containing protein [Candidatus Hydrogenedentes bacterium]|nr:zinc ribbon domain-containing protein [Candidatus Hydrogenedentota bacterium]
MPVFNYVCEDCGARNELLARGGEAPPCPACGSTRMVKQASTFAPVGAGGAPARPGPCPNAQPCCQARGGTCPYSE